MSDNKRRGYKTIGPRQLEEYLGNKVGRIESYWLEGKIWEPIGEWLTLEKTSDGDLCFTGGPYGNMRVRLKHGDMVSVWKYGDCIFIDDSD